MIRLATPLELDADPEEAVTVDVAARRLGVDSATVRAMVRSGELDGFKAGKGREPGGVRIEAASIREYKRRHRINGTPANDAERLPRSRPIHNAAHEEVKRRFRARGII